MEHASKKSASGSCKTLLKRIDFVGPAGVGKTTLYQRLARDRRAAAGWVTESELQGICGRKILHSQETSFRKLAMTAAIQFPYLERGLKRYILHQDQERAFEEFCESYGDFLKAALEGVYRADKSEFRRATGYYRFIWYIMRWSVFMKWAPGLVVVSDESITQRMQSVLPWSEFGIELCGRYCEDMPAPAGLVSVSDEPELIVDRVIERYKSGGKLVFGHRGQSRDSLLRLTRIALRFAETARRVSEARKVPVLELEGESGVEHNTELAESFIRRHTS